MIKFRKRFNETIEVYAPDLQTTIGFANSLDEGGVATNNITIPVVGMAYDSIRKESLVNKNILDYICEEYENTHGESERGKWFAFTTDELSKFLIGMHDHLCEQVGIIVHPKIFLEPTFELLKIRKLFTYMQYIESFDIQLHSEQNPKMFGYTHKMNAKQINSLKYWLETEYTYTKPLLMALDYMAANGYEYICIRCDAV